MSTSTRQLLGDAIWARCLSAAEEINKSEMMSTLRNRELSIARYVGLIASAYPVVVGFNKALIRSLAKVDNVVDSWLVKALSDQLKEEQIHNDMWRAMLDEYSIDHKRLWGRFQKEYTQLDSQNRSERTQRVIQSLSRDRDALLLGFFPIGCFPAPVYALYEHMLNVSECLNLTFRAHFASQCAIEGTIYGFVTDSIYPGIVGNEVLDRGPRSTAWWREHCKVSGCESNVSAEEKHLLIARTQLNRAEIAPREYENIVEVVDNTLLLFQAILQWHDLENGGQWDYEEFRLDLS